MPFGRQARLLAGCDDLIKRYEDTNRSDEATKRLRERTTVAAGGKK